MLLDLQSVDVYVKNVPRSMDLLCEYVNCVKRDRDIGLAFVSHMDENMYLAHRDDFSDYNAIAYYALGVPMPVISREVSDREYGDFHSLLNLNLLFCCMKCEKVNPVPTIVNVADVVDHLSISRFI